MHQPRSSRFAVQLPISFSGIHGAGSGFVCELSETGCSVTCEGDVDVGLSVVMHIQLPGENVPVKAEGSIRWTNGMALGVEFHWHRLEEKKRFLHFLDARARAAENHIRRAS
jgi:PilZ domain